MTMPSTLLSPSCASVSSGWKVGIRRRLVLPFGVPEIDKRLPGGRLALGALHEIAGGGNGAVDGAATALFAAAIAARTGAGSQVGFPNLRHYLCIYAPLAT